MNAVANSSAAMNAVVNSSTAMNAVVNSPKTKTKELSPGSYIKGRFLPLKSDGRDIYATNSIRRERVYDILGDWLKRNIADPIAIKIEADSLSTDRIIYYDLDA